ncbi:MAG: hypothetical protein PHS14_04600 [Elusimicrobia bacterium]|nr:hypothetical protein [Elusimicrobiota bacterium]
MNPLTIPMMVKTNQPVLTFVLLALVGAAIVGVCYLMLRHQHHTRKRKKNGRNNHTGHHGNH